MNYRRDGRLPAARALPRSQSDYQQRRLTVTASASSQGLEAVSARAVSRLGAGVLHHPGVPGPGPGAASAALSPASSTTSRTVRLWENQQVLALLVSSPCVVNQAVA